MRVAKLTPGAACRPLLRCDDDFERGCAYVGHMMVAEGADQSLPCGRPAQLGSVSCEGDGEQASAQPAVIFERLRLPCVPRPGRRVVVGDTHSDSPRAAITTSPVLSPFTVRIVARGYEVDSNGHVAGTVLLQYGHHARWECMRAAGIDQAALAAKGVGPVSLEERIRFHHEIQAGQEIVVSCEFAWGEGKSFRIKQDTRLPDGTLAAEIANVGGLLDLKDRRLVRDPGQVWKSVATVPQLLGLLS
jgi:acyl-CoA thioester hydrolase